MPTKAAVSVSQPGTPRLSSPLHSVQPPKGVLACAVLLSCAEVAERRVQVGDKIIEAIRAVRTHKGASRVAITKYLAAEAPELSKVALAAAFKKLVADKKLSQVWASLLLVAC